MVVTSLTKDKLVCKNGIKTLRLSSSHISLKMSYSKCGLCLQDLEVIKPASGIRYIRCLNWKECPFFCPEENINGYQHCIYDRVVPEYKVCEGGKPLKSQCWNISRISNQFRKIEFWFIPPKQPFGMVISENDIKKSPSALHLDNFRKVRKFTKKYNFYS